MNVKKVKHGWVYSVFFTLLSVAWVFPILLVVVNSFKKKVYISRRPFELPLGKMFVELENYIGGMEKIQFFDAFKNSLFISTAATLGAVLSSALVGYGFARCDFPLKNFWFGCMLLSMMLPFQVIMIPQYILFNELGWIGTYLPLIVPQFCAQGFFVFLNVQFIKGLPVELDEAAKIDGAGTFRVFVSIILPLVKSSIVTGAIFSFMWRWDDFLAALLYLNKPARYPVSLALKLFSDPTSGSDWGAMFAMATCSLLPIFFIFLTMQKYLVEGIASTGIKG